MKRRHLLHKSVKEVTTLKRKYHSHIIRKAHDIHGISYATLFYLKEYGPKSNVVRVILRQSVMVVLLASILSSIGGIGLQNNREALVMFLPFLILLPALASMIGNFGILISSKFTTMLYQRKIKKQWWRTHPLHKLFVSLLVVAAISMTYATTLAFGIAYLLGNALNLSLFFSTLQITIFLTFFLVSIVFFISVVGGLFLYHRKEDPNNFLIPITTAIADLGTLLLFSYMISWIV